MLTRIYYKKTKKCILHQFIHLKNPDAHIVPSDLMVIRFDFISSVSSPLGAAKHRPLAFTANWISPFFASRQQFATHWRVFVGRWRWLAALDGRFC
jgi:hypothetical protein